LDNLGIGVCFRDNKVIITPAARYAPQAVPGTFFLDKFLSTNLVPGANCGVQVTDPVFSSV
jgi:hypothetical protein